MTRRHSWVAWLGRAHAITLKARHHRRQQTQNHVRRPATLLVLQDEDEADDALSRATPSPANTMAGPRQAAHDPPPF
jgi:hypothetical protein